MDDDLGRILISTAALAATCAHALAKSGHLPPTAIRRCAANMKNIAEAMDRHASAAVPDTIALLPPDIQAMANLMLRDLGGDA